LYGDREVGELSADSGRIRFEYSPGWLEEGFSISPISLPLEKRSFIPEEKHFGGLFGVFADSLPDWWGTYVSSLAFSRKGKSYTDLGPLVLLASVGSN
jgi:serine/threonine-protein kinase HipA